MLHAHFGADALRMLVAEAEPVAQEESKGDPAVRVVRGQGGSSGVATMRADPLAAARAARVAGPAQRRGFSPEPVAPSSPVAAAPAPVPTPSPVGRPDSVPQPRRGFGGFSPPPVRDMRPAEMDVTPASGASTVVNPTTRRFLHRWAAQNLGSEAVARVDDDLDLADIEDDLDF